jgi:hypothetical protein
MAEDGLAPLASTKMTSTVARAATVDATVPVVIAPFAGVVTKVTYTPAEAVAGKATNFRTLTATNKGKGGAGTNVVASFALSAAERSLTALQENAITLSGETAKLVVAEGDVIAFGSVHTGEGLADPGGLVSVTIARS